MRDQRDQCAATFPDWPFSSRGWFGRFISDGIRPPDFSLQLKYVA